MLAGTIRILESLAVLAAVLIGPAAQAGMGLVELPADAISGPVTVSYPSDGAEDTVARAAFRFDAAPDGPRSTGDRRLVLGAELAGTAWHGHVDPRISAIVAGVPFAADVDPDSLRHPARLDLAVVEFFRRQPATPAPRRSARGRPDATRPRPEASYSAAIGGPPRAAGAALRDDHGRLSWTIASRPTS